MILSLDTIVAKSDPPFQITPAILALAGEIERLVGRAEGLDANAPQPLLRKRNRVRTVRSSVAIEGNTLTEEQVTALLAGKRVAGSRREILEVTNANAAYERAADFTPSRERDLLAAHRIMMAGLVESAGRFRSSNVGVLHGTKVAHVAPPASRVPGLVRKLLAWMKRGTSPPLVRSCVAHYELLFIHPFVDGNGRMARLWQHVSLLEGSALFAVVPVESVIRERQATYYEVLGACDHAGESTLFIAFILEAMRDALAESLPQLRPVRPTPATRLESSRNALGRRWFTRGAYLALHQTIATATASRDLAQGIADGVLESRGERRLTEYRFR